MNTTFRRLFAYLYIIHPLIFAVYFPTALWAANLGEVLPSNVMRSIGVSLIFALLLWGAVQLIIRDWNKSALVASIAILLFFLYGHIYGLVKAWTIGNIFIARHRWLVPLWGILFLVLQ